MISDTSTIIFNPTAVRPQMVRHSLRPIEEETEREAPEASTGLLRALILGNEYAVAGLEKLWEEEMARLKHGVSGHHFLKTVEVFIDCLQTIQRLSMKIDGKAAEKGDDAFDVRANAQKVLVRVEPLLNEALRFQQRLAPAYKPESLADLFARAEKAASDPNAKYEDGDVIMARIQAGGDI